MLRLTTWHVSKRTEATLLIWNTASFLSGRKPTACKSGWIRIPSGVIWICWRSRLHSVHHAQQRRCRRYNAARCSWCWALLAKSTHRTLRRRATPGRPVASLRSTAAHVFADRLFIVDMTQTQTTSSAACRILVTLLLAGKYSVCWQHFDKSRVTFFIGRLCKVPPQRLWWRHLNLDICSSGSSSSSTAI